MTTAPFALPVLPDDDVLGWPKHHNDAPEIGYVDPADAFTRVWLTDAHFAAYSVPGVRRRLTLEAVGGLAGGWPMVVLVIDVDHPWKKEKPKDNAGREAKRLRVDAWWAEELTKIDALLAAHPGAIVHRSRSGGYRLVWRLASPFVICTTDDKEAWRVRYRRELLYLARRWGIVGDPACADITRLYRLPFVTPEGGPPTVPDLRGDPAALGVWGHEPCADELPSDTGMAQTLATLSPKTWHTVLRALTPQGGGQTGEAAPELRPEDQDEERLFKRAAAYLASMAPSIEGAGGNAQLWAAALAMVRGFNLGAETGASIIERDFNPRCRPAWDRAEIRRTCRNAANHSEVPWGYLRDAEGGEKGLNHKPSQRRQQHHRPTDHQTTDRGATMPGQTATDHDQVHEEQGPASGPQPANGNDTDERPAVLVDFETGQRIRETEAALAARDDLNLYVRDGRLVSVQTSTSKRKRAIRDDAGSPLARDLELPALRAMLTDTIRFEQLVTAKDEKGKIIWGDDGKAQTKRMRCRPHDDIVKGLHKAPEWPELRDLVGIVRAPFLASLDGTVVTSAGYHEGSGYLLVTPPGYEAVDVPDRPTREQALAAVATLKDLLCDFPFAGDRDRSAALAALLSLAARPALGGENVPGFVFEANTSSAGKTKLADTLAIIATGAQSPKQGFTRDEAEMEKLLGGLAGEARALLTFDNITDTIGGSKLDLVLTCNGSFSYRLLGHNRTVQSAWRTVVFFTANNPTIGGDIGRRLVVCRLDCAEAQPSKREGFKYQLPRYALEHRARLAGCALTILRAFCQVPERLRPKVRAMGSFEVWSQLVAGALLWLGEVDPLEAVADERNEGMDPHRMAHVAIVEHWNGLRLNTRSALRWTDDGISVRAAVDALYPSGGAAQGDGLDDLREALEVLAPPAGGKPPTVAKVGYALRHLRDKLTAAGEIQGNGQPTMGGKLVGMPDRKGVMVWRVESKPRTKVPGMPGIAGDVSSQSYPAGSKGEGGVGSSVQDGGHDETRPRSGRNDPRQSPASPAAAPGSADPSPTPPPVSGVATATAAANDPASGLEFFE